MRVELGPEADAELEVATAWYLAQGLDDGGELAERFVEEVERGMGIIAESPELHAEVDPGVRRVVLQGFPYALIYAVEPDRVFVLAVMHHKRIPGYWRERGRR